MAYIGNQPAELAIDLDNGVVTTTKLANDAVTAAKIVDGTIVADDLATGIITNATVASNAAIAATKVAISGGSNITLQSDGTFDLDATVDVTGGFSVGGNAVVDSNRNATFVTVGTPAGTAAAPAYTFSTDTNTGMFKRGTDQIGFSAGGTEILALTATGIYVDTLGNKTSGGNLTLDVAGDIILDAAGNDVIFKDAGVTFGQITNDSGNMIIYNAGSQMLKGLSGGSNAQFMGSVDAGAGLRLYTDGSNNAVLSALGQNKSMYFAGDDAGVGVNALVLDMANGGNATFSGVVAIGTSPHEEWESAYTGLEVGSSGFIYNRTAGNELFLSSNAYYDSGWKFAANGRASLVDLQSGRVRVRTGNASGSQDGAITWVTALDIAADNGNVGVGKSPGAIRMDVETNLNGNLAGQFKNTHASGSYGIKVMGGHNSSNYSAVFTDKDNTTLMMIRGNGNVGVGTDSIATNTKLHVKAGTNINFEVENSSSTLRLSALNDARSANVPMQFASSSFHFLTGNVGIAETNPVAKLAIKGANNTNFEIQPDISNGVNRITNFNRVTSVYKKLRVDASEHEFYISGNPAVAIDSSGNVNISGSNLDVGTDSATANFTDSNSGYTKYIEIGSQGATGNGDALLVTHAPGKGVGYFGYEAGNDRLIIATDNGGGNNSIEFSVNAGTVTGGGTDNLHSAAAALIIDGGGVTNLGHHSSHSNLLRLLVSYATDNTQRGAISWSDGTALTGQIDTRYDGNRVNMHFGHLYKSGYTTDNAAILGGLGTWGVGTDSPRTDTRFTSGTAVSSKRWGFGGGLSSSNTVFYVINENNVGLYMIHGNQSWTAHSDERIKENIVDVGTVLPSLMDMRCVKYNLISNPDHTKIGFIAQDWESSFPEVVDENDHLVLESDGTIGTDDESDSTTPVKAMAYTETIPLLLKAIQEQQDIIESLTNRVAALEG